LLDFWSQNWAKKEPNWAPESGRNRSKIGLIFERVSQSWENKKVNPEPEYRMKDDACPKEHLHFLFRDEELVPDIFDLE